MLLRMIMEGHNRNLRQCGCALFPSFVGRFFFAALLGLTLPWLEADKFRSVFKFGVFNAIQSTCFDAVSFLKLHPHVF